MPVRPAKPRNAHTSLPASFPSTWNWLSHGPLRGLALERESLQIVAWDDSRFLYRLDTRGELRAEKRFDAHIEHLAVSDTGDYTFVALPGDKLLVLDRNLDPSTEIVLPIAPSAIACDPFGDYVAVASTDARLAVFDRRAKLVGKSTTPQAYKYLAFVPATGQLVAAAEQGVVAGHDHRGQLLWKETMYSTIGSLAVDQSGDTVALAGFGYGVVRFSASGRREGAYHVPRAPHLAAIDFDASRWATASIDGYITLLNYEGNILGEHPLAEKAFRLLMDPLGRFVVLGFASGEIRFFDWARLLDEFNQGTEPARTSTQNADGSNRAAWSIVLAESEEQASAMSFLPGRNEVAVSTPLRTLRVFDCMGELVHESGRLEGTGRMLRDAPASLWAATDRRLWQYDPIQKTSTIARIDLFEISHLLGMDAPDEAIVVESCDQVSRIKMPGNVLWKLPLPCRLASIDVKGDGSFAIALENHELILFDSQGKRGGRFQASRPAPLLVARAGKGWVTASLREPMLRHHRPEDARVSATLNLPWEPWALLSLGEWVVVTRADGTSLLVAVRDGQFHPFLTGNEPREGARYLLLHDGTVARAFRAEKTVVVSRFDGKLLWRTPPLETIHHFEARAEGVWVSGGRSLFFFPSPLPTNG